MAPARWLLRLSALAAVALAAVGARADPADLALRLIGPDGAPVASAVVAAAPGPAGTGLVEMDQVDLQFRPPLLIAVAGQRLRIANSDSRVHHVRCHDHQLNFNVLLRPGERHELELSTSRSLTLLCNIHAEMRARVLIVDSAVYATSDERGRLILRQLPARARRLKVWTRADGYQKPHLELLPRSRPAKTLTITVPAAMARGPKKKPPASEAPLGPAQQSRRLLVQLRRALELRQAGGPAQAAALIAEARAGCYIAGGVRFWLRRRFGRKGAFAIEQRLVALERMLGDQTRDQTAAARAIIAELDAFFAPLIKESEGSR